MVPTLKEIYDRRSKELITEVATDLVMRKFAKKGGRVTSALKRRLRKWIEADAQGNFSAHQKSISGRTPLVLAITSRDLRRMHGKFARSMAAQMTEIAVAETMRKAKGTMNELRRAWRKVGSQNRKADKAFETRLAQCWRVPFSLLELHLHLAREYGAELNEVCRRKHRRASAALVDVLTRLHARCCQIAGEVTALLRAGYADGAMARWRSLHEVAVVLQFIGLHGNSLARRYLDHEAIESWRAADLYMKHCSRLGYAPYSVTELAVIRQHFDAAATKYGKSFTEAYGWASDVLGKKKPDFSDIEKAAGLAHFRPYYKLASHGVHANPKGALFKLGLVSGTNLLAAGPTNYGSADPGQKTALSLNQATAALLMLAPTEERLLVMQVMSELTKEIGNAFVKVQRRIESRELQNRAAKNP